MIVNKLAKRLPGVRFTEFEPIEDYDLVGDTDYL